MGVSGLFRLLIEKHTVSLTRFLLLVNKCPLFQHMQLAPDPPMVMQMSARTAEAHRAQGLVPTLGIQLSRKNPTSEREELFVITQVSSV